MLHTALWQYRERESRVMGCAAIRWPREMRDTASVRILTARGGPASSGVFRPMHEPRSSFAHRNKLMYELAVVTSMVRGTARRALSLLQRLLLFIGLLHVVARLVPALRLHRHGADARVRKFLPALEVTSPSATDIDAARPAASAASTSAEAGPAGASSASLPVRGYRHPPPKITGGCSCDD